MANEKNTLCLTDWEVLAVEQGLKALRGSVGGVHEGSLRALEGKLALYRARPAPDPAAVAAFMAAERAWAAAAYKRGGK